MFFFITGKGTCENLHDSEMKRKGWEEKCPVDMQGSFYMSMWHGTRAHTVPTTVDQLYLWLLWWSLWQSDTLWKCSPRCSPPARKHAPHVCRHRIWHWGLENLFVSTITCCGAGIVHFVSVESVSSFLSPWLWHLCPSLSPLLSLLTSSFPPCLIGIGLCSQWRCVHIQLVCVMLCCLVPLSNGHGGQESSWTRTYAHTCSDTYTYTHKEDSLFIPLITILPVSLREQDQVEGMCCCFTLERHPSALE